MNYPPDKGGRGLLLLKQITPLIKGTEGVPVSSAERDDSTTTSHRFTDTNAISGDPDAALRLFESIPFLNGGLFECLDKPVGAISESRPHEKILRIDGFSDREGQPASSPE